MRAQFVLHEIWTGLRRNLTMTVAVIATVAICLTMFGTGLLIRQQVNGMRSYWNDRIEVSIYLCIKGSETNACRNNGPATATQRNQISSTLRNLPQVSKVTYESQSVAYQRFKQSFKSTPAFVKVASKSEMPDSFRVKLHNPKDYSVVADAITGKPGVDSVLNEQQVLNRFFDILNALRNAALFVALIQIVAAILLIGNTIRLAAYNRRKETGIMRLVGSSNIFIQLPFLLEGATAGLIGGGIAAGFLLVAKLLLFDRLQNYFTFATQLGWGAVIYTIVVSIVTGVLLCVLASFITLRRYLRV